MLNKNLQKVLSDISGGNNKGEPITLVGATKFVPVDVINEAISLGLTDIGENKAQEFRDKFPIVSPCNYHFIGTIQTNKIKYLIGKASLIESVSSYAIIDEISRQSVSANVTSNVLLQVNIGNEENKHGFSLEEISVATAYASKMPNVKVLGLMAMLPDSDNEPYLISLCESLRAKYDELKPIYDFKHLSLGMSGDYLLTIKHGSNMIRVGSLIFGSRY
ncbi:MAG: YggS family pyridoxal phosphate-dependent enzyme [Clostridia bacterium]|nr:YggS family pyridoxal phosphate-dependent enzyme [Clostridia bacterium]